MSTRGILGFRLNRKTKGTYVHMDTYPSGLGKGVSAFLEGLTQEAVETLKNNVRAVTWVSAVENATQQEKEKYACFSAQNGSSDKLIDWYWLLQKIQGTATLKHLLDGSLTHLTDDTDFFKQSPYCEWAYIINFDNETLDIYKGSFSETVPIKKIKQVSLVAPFSDLKWLSMTRNRNI